MSTGLLIILITNIILWGAGVISMLSYIEIIKRNSPFYKIVFLTNAEVSKERNIFSLVFGITASIFCPISMVLILSRYFYIINLTHEFVIIKFISFSIRYLSFLLPIILIGFLIYFLFIFPGNRRNKKG